MTIAAAVAVVCLQNAAVAVSNTPSGALITRSEAASVTAHGGAVTLQDCMTLRDPATHMSKQEWKPACNRTLVPEAPDDAH